MNIKNLYDAIKPVANFPQPGIVFQDITPIIASPKLFSEAIGSMCAPHLNTPITKVVGIEARGFFFAVGMALKLNCGFIPIRKAGKLPRQTLQQTYQLEYGESSLEIHRDSVGPKDKVILVDDVLATGGTAKASILLLEQLAATIVSVDFLLELSALSGRKNLSNYPVHSLLQISE